MKESDGKHIDAVSLHAHFEGALSADEQQAMVAHVEKCESCQMALLGIFTGTGMFRVVENKDNIAVEVVDPGIKKRCLDDGLPTTILVNKPLPMDVSILSTFISRSLSQ